MKKCTFGPVLSRRLGRSLGIDLFPDKICSFDCIYCECGPTRIKTIKRENFMDPEIVLAEIAEAVKVHQPDVVTFSGSGEPTLFLDMEYLAEEIRKITDKPLVMITNSSLLFMPEVQKSLLNFDMVLPSLDSAGLYTFNLVNRPHPKLSLQEIIRGLAEFSHAFKGKLWLEILLCEGVNDTEEDIRDLTRALKDIRTDQIQINSVDRPPAYQSARSLSREKLAEFAQRLNGTVISRGADPEAPGKTSPDEKNLLNSLSRRPETLEALAAAFSCSAGEMERLLARLENKGLVGRDELNGQTYFRALPMKNDHSK
ncbi:MAG: radical SAM protein [Candidatus Wallbacteria bacterium]|nr:radical SAM protein [Candidatus Wallbacteria bacterium]